ncbi:MarR family transcriptional regulator [Roseibium sp. TrichSKD4]|uniref:MarR family winged helix-turn-helix transcriptional regulator n=1 Tax=Roseibium sp. TrichSKD4 TaxID=744980 RepID=UPI0001E56AD2|nr:MarR family transcriptional regulator [Roseibium sp. TrichSKD4]EFO30675.1 MarR family transcriptional regulator [Roseibium sp. TrichSKD4]
MHNETLAAYFGFFNEIGIIEQLSRTLLEARLPDGLTAAHFGVLNHLIRVKDGQTPVALAQAFQVPKTTMTHTLGGLERRKLVTLSPNPEDGRSKCVWLTEDGRQLRDAAILALAPDIAELQQQIPLESIIDLLPKLAEIRSYLDANRDNR